MAASSLAISCQFKTFNSHPNWMRMEGCNESGMESIPVRSVIGLRLQQGFKPELLCCWHEPPPILRLCPLYSFHQYPYESSQDCQSNVILDWYRHFSFCLNSSTKSWQTWIVLLWLRLSWPMSCLSFSAITRYFSPGTLFIELSQFHWALQTF